ncbi:unnamed protein product, partial [Linum tenue]
LVRKPEFISGGEKLKKKKKKSTQEDEGSCGVIGLLQSVLDIYKRVDAKELDRKAQLMMSLLLLLLLANGAVQLVS